jgi:hypothetical protein
MLPICAVFEKDVRKAVSLCGEDLERRLGFILPYNTTAEGSDKLANIGVCWQVPAELRICSESDYELRTIRVRLC